MIEEKTDAQPIDILYVEDDFGDVALMEESLKEIRMRISLNIVNTGDDALSYLRRKGKFTKANQPDLILLDLNLPGIDGRELLEIIKKDALIRQIPVVVLTTSDADADIAKTYASGAASYVKKPLGFEEFSNIIKSIEGFWFSIVKYPPKGTG